MATKLGILAGGGPLPARLIEVCRASGREIFVLAFEGQTEPATVAGKVPHAWVKLGRVGEALRLLHDAAVEELVMIGPVTRPSLKQLRLDLKGAQLVAKLGAGGLGDDALLRGVLQALENEGFRVVGIDSILSDLLAPRGPYGAHRPDDQAEADIQRGVAVVRALGAVDVGQAAVVQQGIVLGVEAVEGTDRLLERAATLRRPGLGGVLVKLCKPGQETRVDLPAIGPGTIENAAAAGLRGIGLHAGRTLMIDRDKAIAAADAAGLFLLGLDLD